MATFKRRETQGSHHVENGKKQFRIVLNAEGACPSAAYSVNARAEKGNIFFGYQVRRVFHG